ncbi:MAG: hypothetical protein ACPG5T_05765, partial [Endozoicomonas sp.]
GYIIDLKFVNAYISAMREKQSFVSSMSGSGILNSFQLEEDPEDRKPYILTAQFLRLVIAWYGDKTFNEFWVKEERFLNPADFEPLKADESGYWSKSEMEDLIGTYAWDIIDDPFSTEWKISDIMSHEVWNGMYILFRDVFNYVEQENITSNVLQWEEWGFPASSSIDLGTVCPLDKNNPNCADAELNEFALAFEEKAKPENYVLVNFGGGRRFLRSAIAIDLQKNIRFRDFPEDYDPANNEHFTYKHHGQCIAYSKRIHNIRNINDEITPLEISGQGSITNNHIGEDVATSKSGLFNPFLFFDEPLNPSKPQKTSGEATIRDLYTFGPSYIENDRWVIESEPGPVLPYLGRGSDFNFDYDDIPTPEHVLRNGEGYIKRNFFYGYSTGFANGVSDCYYKSNSPGMIYAPVPVVES